MSLSRDGGDEDGVHSPNRRLKFLCSYGGKILPRPFDGQLKYVGGETRAVSVSRSITFKELKDKISIMFSNPEIVIKYQVFPEDLDTLVSVRTDEDLRYMLEEYDRHESLPRSPSSSPRFRIFVFPSSTTRIASPSSSSPTHLDDVKNAKGSMNASIPSPRPPPVFTISPSTCSSSPPSNLESPFPVKNTRSGGLGMHRVRSSPNLGGGSLSHLGNNSTNDGTPIGGGGGGALNINNHHPPPQQQQQQRMMGYGGTRSRVGVSYRYETCACGRVFARGGQICGHRGQMRYHYPPPYSGGGGRTCGFRGHMEESRAQPNSASNSINIGATSPRARMKSIWE